MKLSVILCTHNPRREVLQRVLLALSRQTLPPQLWELIIVDNRSTEPVAGQIDLTWHRHARTIVEPELGLTHARLCGIRDSAEDLIVFVDDDNLLGPNYLERAHDIAQRHTFLGAWGGAVVPEFEIPPPPWLKPYLGLLALREPTVEMWSNFTRINDSMPCGAGLCVRRPAALAWMKRAQSDPRRLALGRIGAGLGAGEDADLAFTACDLGYGCGVFPQLRLEHVIPKRRLSLEYFERLVEEMYRSSELLTSLRYPVEPLPTPTLLSRALQAYRRSRMSHEERVLARAADRGMRQGRAAALRAHASAASTDDTGKFAQKESAA